MRYSDTTKTFYPEFAKYTDLPADLVTVPDSDFVEAMGRDPRESITMVNGRVVAVAEPNESKLTRAKAAKAEEIESAFQKAEATPVPVNGWQFKGGFTSGLAIDAQRRAAELYRQLNPQAPDTATFFEVHGTPVTVPLLSDTEIDAADICLSISYIVSLNIFKYEQLRNAVWSATTEEEVAAISWE